VLEMYTYMSENQPDGCILSS